MAWTTATAQSESWTTATSESESWTTQTEESELWATLISGSYAPVITSISPSAASSEAVITIRGLHFIGVTSVRLDDVAAVFTVVDDNTITATVP